jgi:hypothetical protein
MIALFVCIVIVAPFTALIFACGRWWERRSDEWRAPVIHLPVRHPSRHHRTPRHVRPHIEQQPVPPFNFEKDDIA